MYQEDLPDDVAAMVTVIERVFWDYPSDKLERLWGCLAEVYKQTLLLEGQNIPTTDLHGHVTYRQQHGQDPVNLHMDREVWVKFEKLNALQDEYWYEHLEEEEVESESDSSEDEE